MASKVEAVKALCVEKLSVGGNLYGTQLEDVLDAIKELEDKAPSKKTKKEGD